MTTLNTPPEPIDLLDIAHEPSDEAFAAVMVDMVRVVRENRNIAFMQLHKTATDDLRESQSRARNLRKQYGISRL
jgi:hypothetical protein